MLKAFLTNMFSAFGKMSNVNDRDLVEPNIPLSKRSRGERIAVLSGEIAKEFQGRQKEIEKIMRAARLHSIGMIAAPDYILHKPDKLTEEEMQIIRKHPIQAFKILRWTCPEEAAILRHHHEWWDGTGYPDGLKGEQIPPGSRIIAVATAFDAMTRNSSWREPLSVQGAIAEIKAHSGKQFDPDVVNAFLRVMARTISKVTTQETAISAQDVDFEKIKAYLQVVGEEWDISPLESLERAKKLEKDPRVLEFARWLAEMSDKPPGGKGLSGKEIIRRLNGPEGAKFDPKIVRAFLQAYSLSIFPF